MNATWTEERVEQMKALHTDGRSASQIAALLGGITRNAVCGKLHRMHLTQGVERRTKPAKKKGKRKAFATKRPPDEELPPPDFLLATLRHHDQPPSLNIAVQELVDATDEREGTCKWPYGDEAPYAFCGQPTTAGGPYCQFHHARAYVPLSQRRRKGTSYWIRGGA